MPWNWQQPDWPQFTHDPDALAPLEAAFLHEAGVFIGAARHLTDHDRALLTVELLGREALTTSEIEGEVLNRESVQSSLRRRLGLSADPVRATPAEQGIAEMMVDLFRSFAEPLTHDTLFAWHRMVTSGRRDLTDIGRYRTHREPMQVVSGAMYDPRVHFEAPPAARVPTEMERFVDWFNDTAPDGSKPLPPVTRSGIAHLYFESVHPFEDGNGRIGRAVSEKALAQGLGQSPLVALAPTILRQRSRYYDELERANKKNEVTNWLKWFGAVVVEAQRRTLAEVEFTIEKTRLLDRLRGSMNDRQERALLRMMREGADGFEGGMSAAKYRAITGAPTATATRDLAELVELGALSRSGEKKGARYHLTITTAPRSEDDSSPREGQELESE